MVRARIAIAPFCLALGAAIAAPRAARADDSPEDTVRLEDGDVYRGVLLERVSGDHVTLRLASGEVRRFPWEALAPTETDLVRVEIDSDDARAVLSRRAGTGPATDGAARAHYGTIWEDVCAAPCDRTVDATRTYRIEGEGIWPSGSFQLPPGAERLHVKAGSRTGVIGGAMLTLLGGGLTLMGGLVLGFSTLPVDPSDPHAAQDRDAKSAFLSIGLVTLAVGALSLAAGIPLWMSSTTTVTTERGRTIGSL